MLHKKLEALPNHSKYLRFCIGEWSSASYEYQIRSVVHVHKWNRRQKHISIWRSSFAAVKQYKLRVCFGRMNSISRVLIGSIEVLPAPRRHFIVKWTSSASAWTWRTIICLVVIADRCISHVTMNRRLVLRKTKAPKFKEKLIIATDVIVNTFMHFSEPDASTV